VGLAVLFIAATTMDSYSTEHPYTGENPLAITRDHMSLAERLGYAVLLRSGYGALSKPVYDEGLELPQWISDAPPVLQLNESHPDFACVSSDEYVHEVQVQRLTLAIAAVEMYNRRSARRSIEEHVAGASLRLTGRLPSMSLGVAQIRPEAARAVLEADLRGVVPPDGELLALLRDRCHNLRIAGRIIRGLVEDAAGETPQQIVVDVARHYSGSSTVDGRNSWYFEAVRGAYDLASVDLQNAGVGKGFIGEPYDFGDEIVEPPTRALECLRFPMASETPFPWSNVVSEHAQDGIVTVYFNTSDAGPPGYSARLNDLRLEHILAQLRSLGYSDERIVLGRTAPREISTACAAGGTAGTMILDVEFNRFRTGNGPPR
jgi:hypothetical protein